MMGLGIFEGTTPVVEAYRALLASRDQHGRDGTLDTPDRAARAWTHLTGGYDTDVPSLFRTFESDDYVGTVEVAQIRFYSLCEHHLLPFYGTCDVTYTPNGRIVGLSKIARVVDAYARRLQVQERMTQQIAQAIHDNLHPVDVSVVIRAEHLCMAMRGVEAPGTITTTRTRIVRE